MATLSFVVDVAAPTAAQVFDGIQARLGKLDESMRKTRELAIGDKSAQATLLKASVAMDRLRERVEKPMDLTLGGAQKAELKLLELEATAGRLDKKLAQADATGLAGLGSRLSALGGAGGPMTALIGTAAALAPIVTTLGLGLGGLGLAALPVIKNSREMHQVMSPLTTEVSSFQKALQPDVLKIFGQGAHIAAGFLHDLQPVAAATGKALSGVLGQVGAEFRSGTWQQFFGFMGKTAGPDLQLVGKLLIDMMNDIPGLLEQLQPAGRAVLLLADDALKLVGVADRLKITLPLLGAAIGYAFGGMFGPEGALIGGLTGGLAGLVIQLAAAGDAAARTGLNIQKLQSLPSRGTLSFIASTNWKAVAAGLHGLGLDAATAGAGVSSMGTWSLLAAPKVGTLAGDMSILDQAVGSANSAIAAYSDLWLHLVGTAVSDQQAVLNVAQAFDAYNTTAASSRKTSVQVQLSFLSIFDAIGTGLDTLHKNRDSVAAINSLYTTSISRLQSLHGLSATQRSDIAGLVRDYLAWASSTDGLNKKTVTAAAVIAGQFTTALQGAHHWTPQVALDMTAFASEILKTGDNSRATALGRQQLITDLEKAGLSAKGAKQLVKDLQAQIDGLHGKTVSVTVHAAASGVLKAVGSGVSSVLKFFSGFAAGGLVPGPGSPVADDRLARVSAGELIVPAWMVSAGAVDHLRGQLPGFAGGGLVRPEDWAARAASGWATGAEKGWGNAAVAAFRAAAARQQAAQGAGGYAGPGGGAPGANVALAQRVLGWTGGEFADLVSLWTRESGWNQFARNPGSGAYGIPQALPFTKMPMAAWPAFAGGSSNVLAQITWGDSYIRGRYGTPSNAWAHELAMGWYKDGLDGIFSGRTLIGVGERGPERVTVTPVGRGGRHGGGDTYITYNVPVSVSPGVHPAQAGKAVVEAIKEYERVNGKNWRS